MRERDLSQTQMFEIVGAELELGPKSRTAFRAFLQRREPTDDQAAILRKHFGEPPPQLTPEPEPQPDLLSAINALVKALDADREERQALTRAIAALAQSLATRAECEESPAQPALQGTTG
jgi:hypothetical protein